MGSGLASIGIPTYKRPESLRRILKIAVEQTYRRLEIVVSDDASPDDRVRTIASEFAASDPRVRYFRQDRNLGVLANAEFTLRRSTGEYFTLFSEDDRRAPEFVARLVAELEKEPGADAAFCDYAEVLESGVRAPGYPTSHIPVFRPFRSRSRLRRVLSYYWQDPRRGQRNLFYSVFRREALAALDWKRLSGDYARLNMDDLLMFAFLQRGRAALNEGLMCELTVGNEKHYADDAGLWSGASLAARGARFWRRRAEDLALYAGLTDSALERALLAALFLPKNAKDALARLAHS
jgi:glycosyltransferase involved in cell wall biosynthesis